MRKKAWVEQLLTKRAAIERAIGMPLGNMLGCGHWGCVFESEAPWVVKLSIDPTEGPIWSKIVGLVREEQWGTDGFVEVKSIHRITPDIVYGGKKRKVWAIVREGIEPVYENTRAGLRFTQYSAEQLGIPSDTNPHRTSLEDFGHQAQDFAVAMDGLQRYRIAARAWHGFRGRFSSAEHRYSVTGYESREAVEYKLNRIAETMFHGGQCAPLGESLNMLASNGIFLRDVHQLNIGWHLPRDPDSDWARVVIFDPGHTPTKATDGIETALVENPREAL